MKATPVYVFGEQPGPVFHALGGARVVEASERKRIERVATRCGRTMWLYIWNGGDPRWTEYAVRLRRDWAEQIGRPCSKCYPKALTA